MPDQDRLRRFVLQQLKSLRNAGVLDLPRVRSAETTTAPTETSVSAAGTAPSGSANQTGSTQREENPVAADTSPGRTKAQPQLEGLQTQGVSWSGPPLPCEERKTALDSLRQQVAACRRCEELVQNRTQTVFGVGNPMARLVFLGEAPGADEDKQGEPFVGRAGQLLTKIIEACTLRREDVYILNILKCRPPGNRNPQPREASNCSEYLRQQLEIIRPEFICCLGAVAAQNLLDTTASIGQLRGQLHPFGKIQVVATYHPAYLLRNPNAKRATWEDMKFLMKHMGIELPSR